MRFRTPIVLLIPSLLLTACGGPEPGPVAKPAQQSRAKVEVDRTLLIASLDSLAAWHAGHGTGWNDLRREGRATSTLENLFDGESFVVPDELAVIWRHHDGTRSDRVRLDGVHHLLSADETRAAFDSLRADPGTPWRHNWIPVLRGDDEWIAVEASRRTAPGAPVVVWTDEGEARVAATNLTLYWAVVAAAVSDGALRVDGGAVTGDPARWRRAHAELDPQVEFAWGTDSGVDAP